VARGRASCRSVVELGQSPPLVSPSSRIATYGSFDSLKDGQHGQREDPALRKRDPAQVVQPGRGSPDAHAAAARPRRTAGSSGNAGACFPDESHRAGSQHRALDRHSRTRFSTSSTGGGRRRFVAPSTSSAFSRRRPRSTSRTKASARPAATSRTRRCRRPGTTNNSASSA
jgi:hypothetical protein